MSGEASKSDTGVGNRNGTGTTLQQTFPIFGRPESRTSHGNSASSGPSPGFNRGTPMTSVQSVTDDPTYLKCMRELEISQTNAMTNFRRFDLFEKPFPEMKKSPYHTIMFLLPELKNYRLGDVLHPYPGLYVSTWDPAFVRMPCSDENLRLIKARVLSNGAEANESSSRNDQTDSPQSTSGSSPTFSQKMIKVWSKIKEELTRSPIKSTADIGAIMKSYYRESGSLNVLNHTLDKTMSSTERENFFVKVLPAMVKLCVNLPDIVTAPIPLLVQHKNHSISFTQKQIASILASAFFSTFPDRFENENNYPSINFNGLFSCPEKDSSMIPRAQKLRCLLHYFERVTSQMPTGVVTYTRKSTKYRDLPDWKSSKSQLKQMVVRSEGTIEDDGVSMLQIDFANKYVGGGVLGHGTVQEEILFVTYPELLVARLFTEVLGNSEALTVTGCERYAKYSGYSKTFKFGGNFVDTTPSDSRGRKMSQWIAIDAMFIPYNKLNNQYQYASMMRELNKAYVGISYPHPSAVGVATGKWGCGAFNGNCHLKAMLQYLAASEAGRDVAFFTFGDLNIQDDLLKMVQALKNKTVGEVFQLLIKYNEIFISMESKNKTSVYDFICEHIPLTPLAVHDKPHPAPATKPDTPIRPISEEEFYGFSSEEMPFEVESKFPKVKNSSYSAISRRKSLHSTTSKSSATPEVDVVEDDQNWLKKLAMLKSSCAARGKPAATSTTTTAADQTRVPAVSTPAPPQQFLTGEQALQLIWNEDSQSYHDPGNSGDQDQDSEMEDADNLPPARPPKKPSLIDFYK